MKKSFNDNIQQSLLEKLESVESTIRQREIKKEVTQKNSKTHTVSKFSMRPLANLRSQFSESNIYWFEDTPEEALKTAYSPYYELFGLLASTFLENAKIGSREKNTRIELSSKAVKNERFKFELKANSLKFLNVGQLNTIVQRTRRQFEKELEGFGPHIECLYKANSKRKVTQLTLCFEVRIRPYKFSAKKLTPSLSH
ncbi:MAG: hypothetical protein ACPGJV_14075 [Bacteriovoracaceae bacterium]